MIQMMQNVIIIKSRKVQGVYEMRRLQLSTFLKWLIPYIVIVLVPICFGVLLYHQSIRTVERDVEQIQQQTLEHRMVLLEKEFQSMRMRAYSLVSCEEAVALMEQVGEEYNTRQIQKSSELQADLVSVMSNDDLFADISLYFPETGYLLRESRFTELSKSTSQLSREYGMTEVEILQCAEERFSGFRVVEKNGSENLLYFYSFGNNKYSAPRAMVIFQINHLYIEEILEITDANVYLELASGGDYLKKEWMSEEAVIEDYYLMEQENREFGFRLVNLLRMEEYQKPIRFMEQVLLLYLVGCLLFGVGSVWFTTRKNYKPVQELRQMASRMLQEQYIRDDVEAVKYAYQNLEIAYEQEYTMARSARSHVKNSQMNQLLKQRSDVKGVNPPERWKELCPEPFFLLMSVEILDFAVFTEKDGILTSEMMDVAYFALENVLEELEKEEKMVHINAQTDGMLFSLINFPVEKQEYILSQVQMVASRLKNFMHYQFHMPLSINVSSRQLGWESIGLCYQEIQQIVEFRSYSRMGEEEIVLYSQCEMGDTEDYDRQCRRLSAALESRDMELARKLFKTVTDGTKEAAREKDNSEVIHQIEKIATYIDQHYAENHVTVGFLADEFDLNLSWLSRNFKKERGIGILEYINTLRMTRAKELIREGKTVREVALLVGFTDAQPLNRMFRRMFGMSPTEYRMSEDETK